MSAMCRVSMPSHLPDVSIGVRLPDTPSTPVMDEGCGSDSSERSQCSECVAPLSIMHSCHLRSLLRRCLEVPSFRVGRALKTWRSAVLLGLFEDLWARHNLRNFLMRFFVEQPGVIALTLGSAWRTDPLRFREFVLSGSVNCCDLDCRLWQLEDTHVSEQLVDGAVMQA